MHLRRKQKSELIKAKIRRNIFGWLLLLPPILLFVFFVWYPITFNIILSFFKDNTFKEFVWFNNYVLIFKDPKFISALKNTFMYIFWSLIIGFLVPLIIGLLLSEVVHAKGVFRVLVYLPCMISGMAVVFLFRSMFGNNNWDIINVILIRVFGAPKGVQWTADPKLVIPVIVFAMTWRGAGGTALIYLSNFQQIDDAIYEASRLDGISPVKRFFTITLPMMKTTIFLLLILQIIAVFQVFYEPMVIAGNNVDALSLMLLAYNYAYVNGEFEYAKSAATSVVLAVIIISTTVLYFGLTRLLDRDRKEKK